MGGPVPFATLGLPQAILKGVQAAGHIEPTPIQHRAIPVIMQGNDLIASAQTGTGKTAAYLLPILSRMLEGPSRLRALVLCPTRELAAQVETYARGYARYTNLRIGVVFSGVPLPPQERMLREEGVDLLVATPGRLLDLYGKQAVRFDDVEMLVLDEADRMVDLGFAPELRRILKLLPETRQTLMISATMPPELNRVAKEALLEPVRVDLAPPPGGAPPGGGGTAHHPGPGGRGGRAPPRGARGPRRRGGCGAGLPIQGGAAGAGGGARPPPPPPPGRGGRGRPGRAPPPRPAT